MLTKQEESSVASAAAGYRRGSGPQWGEKVPPGILLLLGCPVGFLLPLSEGLESEIASWSLLLPQLQGNSVWATCCYWGEFSLLILHGRKVPFLGYSELSATIW